MKYCPKKKSIGLLGGTFDPIHNGHLRISMLALRHFCLDEVWWIISLANPLKKKQNITSFEERIKKAKAYPKGKKIIVSGIEKEIKTPYSIDVINHLIKKNRKVQFVWLQGVDNLEKMHEWKKWREIFYKLPIAIFDRPFYSLNIINSKSIGFFKNKRTKKVHSNSLKLLKPPCWVFHYGWGCRVSSTIIKNKFKS